ncbi:terminase large subunit domain-containing protein [Leucobacter sp. Z1108]|uniref:terminase large subunit domain-containing protein n=1 Tax=Leucobacter sp. Z1108 TaxID=3439066 RepID=UPI003F3BBFA7
MPRRVILNKSEHDRNRSLGYLAVWWIESFVVHGRGGVRGMPIRYGDEYSGFIVDCYALDADGRMLYDSAFFSRPKGTDKSGLAAALVMFEAFGPARFAGFAKGGETYTFLGLTYTYLPGEPMGRSVTNPYIRIMATEEGQTGNVYDSVYYNLTDEDTPLHALVKAYGVDAGKTRIILPKASGGGVIQPTTSGAASKDGGLETFAVFDETHLYNLPGLHEMYDTVVRNLDKRKKVDGTWFIETTTMYAPGEESVAENTYELANLIEEGRARRERLLFDHRWGELANPMQIEGETDEEYEARLSEAFLEAYGDAAAFNSIDAMLNALFDPRRSVEAQRRYFLNALGSAKNAWVETYEWAAVSVKERRKRALEDGEEWKWTPPKAGDTITLGFDGGRTDDATVLIACRVSDRYVWPIFILEAPDSKEAEDWEVDRDFVDAKVAETFKKFKVVAFFADPPLWQDYVDKWEREFGPQLNVQASYGKSIHFWTNRDKPMVEAVERSHTAIATGQMLHGNHLALTRHVMNARRWERRSGTVIGKEKRGSKKKMDAAMGLVLALEACARYTAKGRPTVSTFTPFNPRGNAPTRR